MPKAFQMEFPPCETKKNRQTTCRLFADFLESRGTPKNMVRMDGLEPSCLRTRPSNVRVYQFHHIRSEDGSYTTEIHSSTRNQNHFHCLIQSRFLLAKAQQRQRQRAQRPLEKLQSLMEEPQFRLRQAQNSLQKSPKNFVENSVSYNRSHTSPTLLTKSWFGLRFF